MRFPFRRSWRLLQDAGRWLAIFGVWSAVSGTWLRADPPTKVPPAIKCVLTVNPEIDCPSCEDGIKRILTTARGVQSADIDVLKNRITIRYDPARTSVKALIGRIAVTGYTASEVK